jgi:hypothetical protein
MRRQRGKTTSVGPRISLRSALPAKNFLLLEAKAIEFWAFFGIFR